MVGWNAPEQCNFNCFFYAGVFCLVFLILEFGIKFFPNFGYYVVDFGNDIASIVIRVRSFLVVLLLDLCILSPFLTA